MTAAVERLTRKHFELRHLEAQPVKGIAGPVATTRSLASGSVEHEFPIGRWWAANVN